MDDQHEIDAERDEDTTPGWATTRLATRGAPVAYCARHGRYPAEEWCPGCEAYEETRIERSWVRTGGDRS